jgi:hypothetical protein
MELHDTFLQVHEHLVAIFNVIDCLPELVGISFNVNMTNQMGTLTLLQHIFGQFGTHQFHLATSFLFILCSLKK